MNKVWKLFKEWWGIIVGVLYLSFYILLSIYVNHLQQKEITEMNQEELHYDADGLFIIIDKDKKLIGVYHGTEPLSHAKTEDLLFLEEGVQECPILIK